MAVAKKMLSLDLNAGPGRPRQTENVRIEGEQQHASPGPTETLQQLCYERWSLTAIVNEHPR